MIVLRVAGQAPEDVLVQIRLLALRFPGDHTLRIEVADTASLTLGDRWRYDGSPTCLAALGDFGRAGLTV